MLPNVLVRPPARGALEPGSDPAGLPGTDSVVGRDGWQAHLIE